MFDQTSGLGSPLHPHLYCKFSDHVRLPEPSLPSDQILDQGLTQTPLPEQSASIHSPPPVASAPVRLPVQLLAHRHIPVSAAPAALVRSHPLDARQQLCAQISRRVSCPRSAAVCAHCLWPGRLAPGHQLPANLHRHQRAPRRVRRQHPKVEVPFLRGSGSNAATRSKHSLALSRSSITPCSPSLCPCNAAHGCR